MKSKHSKFRVSYSCCCSNDDDFIIYWFGMALLAHVWITYLSELIGKIKEKRENANNINQKLSTFNVFNEHLATASRHPITDILKSTTFGNWSRWSNLRFEGFLRILHMDQLAYLYLDTKTTDAHWKFIRNDSYSLKTRSSWNRTISTKYNYKFNAF